MVALDQYPFAHHPCFSNSRKDLWVRIHLPVARYCNTKCIFCDGQGGGSCHTFKPGYSSQVMSAKEAIARASQEIDRNSRLRIVAISGPGEPLANHETFETIEGIIDMGSKVNFCLSTNGILLIDRIESLAELNLSSISISMSTQNPSIAARLYQWANIEGHILQGEKMGIEIVKRQLRGIERSSDLGIGVKINTILIPGFNSDDIELLSERISEAGADLQNIVPLVPCETAANLRSPSTTELECVRKLASKNINQFYHCRQCRSDVVGIPGFDEIL